MSALNGRAPALAPAMTSDLPVLCPQGLELRYVAQLALDHVVTGNQPPSIFVRGGRLTRIVLDENDRPRLETLDKDELVRTVLCQRVSFQRRAGRGDEVKQIPIPPPREVVQTVRTLGSWPGLPAIETIVETPVLRADGTVLSEPGYDAATRLYYLPDPHLDVAHIPPEPTAPELAAAVERIRGDVLGDFPFATAADEANAIGLLLTPLVRPAVGCVPLALVDAPRAGTGKGLLASVAARIATGRPAGVFVAPDEEKEWGKSITSLLDDGAAFILIDEAGTLRSSNLAGALTADVHTDRRLGKTEMIRIPQRATWVAAGNNIQLGGDLPRRCYRIRLDPKMARPWTRDGWRHPDLEGWVTEHRGRLLADLLTMARAWYAASRPTGQGPTLGGFHSYRTYDVG